MPISFTDQYLINKDKFAETGALDIILDVDTRVFIDPALLDQCDIPEFENAREKVEKFFRDVISLLNHSNANDDIFWKRADKLLSFSEITGTCIGYTQKGTQGNSIGEKLRFEILKNIKSLIVAGETDPTIFELLGVFQEYIGCDRISDIITYILAHDIYSFSQRLFREFDIDTEKYVYKKIEYRTIVNPYNNKPVLLIPKAFLSPLPVAEDFWDIDDVCEVNERVRNDINSILDFRVDSRLTKHDVLHLMLKNSDFRTALIALYKCADTTAYDFQKDKSGEYSWYYIAKEFAEKYPLRLTKPETATSADVKQIVLQICEHFKELIENHGLSSLLYNEGSKPKHERAAQLLFFGIADAYCSANNIDLSRENNNGRGAVDFKLSRGATEKVIVEIKLTSNPQLKHGFDVQLPIYMKQEKTQTAVYLVIDNGHRKALENFTQHYNLQPKEVKAKLPCILINGIPAPSASIA